MTTSSGVRTENSSTQAASFLGNGTGTGILDTALLAASWVFIETSTAATQGTTGDVQVWRDPGSLFRVGIEVNETGPVLKFVASEAYDATAETWNQPVHGGVAGTSYTPTANSTVVDTGATISGHGVTVMGFYALPMAKDGFTYVIDVTSTLLTVAVTADRSRLHRSYFVTVGHATSLFQAVGDTHPLFLGGTPSSTTVQALSGVAAGTSWATSLAATQGNFRSSRAPGVGAVSTACPFGYQVDFPIPTGIQATTGSTDGTYIIIGTPGSGSSGSQGGIPLGHRGALCAIPVLHGAAAGAITGRGTFRAYLPGYIIYMAPPSNTNLAVVAGESVYVNGSQYYVLGDVMHHGIAHGLLGGSQAAAQVMAVKVA